MPRSPRRRPNASSRTKGSRAHRGGKAARRGKRGRGAALPNPLRHPFRFVGGVWGRIGRLHPLLRIPVYLVIAGAAALLVAGITLHLVYWNIARGFDLADLGKMPARSEVFDRQGVLIGRLHGENRVMVDLADVSPHFVDALLAREDARFYSHGGVDYIGLARAVVENLRRGHLAQGASTITMQLARNSFGMADKTLHRKLVEAALARRIEGELEKDEILELYINRIFFGRGMCGLQRASLAYLGKPARDLTLGESAMLAGIIRSPNRFSPHGHLEKALRERDDVLDRMVLKGFITEAEAEAAKKREIKTTDADAGSAQETYALDAVRRDLDLVLHAADQEDGGLRIYTTLDSTLQTACENALEVRLRAVEAQDGYGHPTKAGYDRRAAAGAEVAGPPDYLQGAVVAIDNDSGGIVALVGGRDFAQSQYNRALHSRRQIGSTFKPFVYAAGMERGLFPGTLIGDGPIRRGELSSVTDGWSPNNSDGKFGGLAPLRSGLVRSRNTMTVRVGDHAGLEFVGSLCEKAGLGAPDALSAQLFIGNHGSTLRDLTSAFTIFPNAGVRRRPFVIDRIETAAGETLFLSGQIEYGVVSPGAAFLTAGILREVVRSGTAAGAARLGYKNPRAGGKTGTTDDYRDAWFVGFNERVTCGVWVGLDQPRRIVARGYGSTLALPVWVDVMKAAEAGGYRETAPRAEPVLAKIDLCNRSARLAHAGCRTAGCAYAEEVPAGMAPREFCQFHRGSGGIAGANAQPAPSGGGNSGGDKKSLWQRIKGIFGGD
ncbi:MAG: transglycosylase domain-containing protein [Verrucomicrobiales bacterium]